ncbi:hypothetical protein BH10PLA1_BH10PLA1_14130 [soil metagenome]
MLSKSLKFFCRRWTQMNADKTKTEFRSAFTCVDLRLIFLLISSVGVVGCRTKPDADSKMPPVLIVPARPASRQATQNAGKAESPLPDTLAPPPRRIVHVAATGPKDPRPPMQLATRFDVYDIVFPVGAVSRREAFWKLIDEDKVDPGTYDVLRRNGMRVGIAPVSDWAAMRELLDDTKSSTRLFSSTGRDLTNLEIMLKHDVLSESLFVYLPDGSLVGRTYERCENMLTVSFQQLPRKPGHLRVSLAPRVRSTRKQLVFSVLGNEREFSFSYPEKTLDLNLRVDIPLDYLLVLAPSEEAKYPSSLGRAFLTQDAGADRQEHVMFMVPRMFQMDDESGVKAGASFIGPQPEPRK